jgi:hypothetical protein
MCNKAFAPDEIRLAGSARAETRRAPGSRIWAARYQEASRWHGSRFHPPGRSRSSLPMITDADQDRNTAIPSWPSTIRSLGCDHRRIWVDFCSQPPVNASTLPQRITWSKSTSGRLARGHVMNGADPRSEAVSCLGAVWAEPTALSGSGRPRLQWPGHTMGESSSPKKREHPDCGRARRPGAIRQEPWPGA